MRKLIFTVLKYTFRFMIFTRLHWPLVFFYAKKLERVKPDNGKVTDPSKPTLLALNVFYFIKDLEILANTGEFNVFKLPTKWQSTLLRLYWTDETWGGSEADFRKANKAYYQPVDPEIIKMQKELRTAMGIFLGSLFRMMKIDAVISANFTYRVDYEYSMVCSKLRVPYIVFHKENLVLSKGLEDYWNIYMEDIGKFNGNLIILHNEKMKDIILKAGFATPEQLVVLGCLRMDDFINRVKNSGGDKKEKFNRITMFSFQKNAGLEMMYNEYFGDKGFVKLFEDYHVLFARAAVKHPEIDFVIKPKYGREWFTAIEEILKKNNILLKDVPNLKMTVDQTAQELIFSSDFVISFQSTTILEAAFAGKPVIVPDFDEVLKPEYQNHIIIKCDYDVFDVAHSADEFAELIENRVKDSSITEEYAKRTNFLFDRYVSSLEAKAVEKYISCVRETILLNKKEKFNNPFHVTAFNKTFKYLFRYLTACNLHWALAYIYSKLSLEKVLPSEGTTDPSKPWILGIKSQYFMSDLDILANTKQFNVYKITNKWQSLILRVYWDDEAWKDGEKSYYQPTNPEVIKYQEKLRGFLKKFLNAFYKMNNIKCVVAANVTYKDCYDWGIATREAGVPYVVLQRENLFACPGLERLWYRITGELGKFHGSSVVLHNKKVKEIYIKSGYSTDEKIAVLGCMRMDGYLKKLKEHDFENEKKHNRAALFSFHHISLLETMYKEYFNPNIGYAKFFENVHVTFARTAIANPDKEFVIKPRSPKVYYDQIRKALERNELDIKQIPNLSMNADVNPHDLILSSDVVCAFASTVILEAAIARRPVIIPYFDETLKPEYQDFILFKEYFNYFDIADSRENLKGLIEKRLENPAVSPEYIKKMTELFEQYVSSFDARSTERYIEYLTDVINNCKR